MVSWFRKKNVSFNDFSFLGVDFHAHFLPGIDDGAANVEESLRLIDGLIGLGYDRLIASPHVMGDFYKNTPETIKASYEILRAEMDARGYTIPIAYAAEYLIDEAFEEKIKTGPLLTFGSNYVLVETMFMGVPSNIQEILFALETHGYQPILAHPERYHYLNDKLEALQVFLERGVLFQSNILSFGGYYGPREKHNAELLLNSGKIDFLGTDIHHLRHLRELQKFSVSEKIAERLLNYGFMNESIIW